MKIDGMRWHINGWSEGERTLTRIYYPSISIDILRKELKIVS
jgi:hypothetical protein